VWGCTTSRGVSSRIGGNVLKAIEKGEITEDGWYLDSDYHEHTNLATGNDLSIAFTHKVRVVDRKIVGFEQVNPTAAAGSQTLFKTALSGSVEAALIAASMGKNNNSTKVRVEAQGGDAEAHAVSH